jgi:hypothetical protein
MFHINSYAALNRRKNFGLENFEKKLIHQQNHQNQFCDISILSNHSEKIKQCISRSNSIFSSIRIDLLNFCTAQGPIRVKHELCTIYISNT